jgi:PPM family protein phosphatase
VRVIAASHRGSVRHSNEDCVGVAGWRSAASECAIEVRPLNGAPVVAVVADGVGGHPGGRVASGVVVDHLMSAPGGVGSVDALSGTLSAANDALGTLMGEDPRLNGMASTVAALVVTHDSVLLGNVGDSRIYELQAGELLCLSIDDSPPRVPGQATALTQVLGGYAPVAPVVPHVTHLQREAGLRFLLCSDGLTDALEEAAIARIVDERAPDWPGAADDLVAAALGSGATDNVSLALVIVDEAEPVR